MSPWEYVSREHRPPRARAVVRFPSEIKLTCSEDHCGSSTAWSRLIHNSARCKIKNLRQPQVWCLKQRRNGF
eukprot:11747-Heterococcus_DN1.PRE.3